MCESIGDDPDDRRLSDHADLRRIDAHVGEQRIDLFSDERRRHGKHSGHRTRVLCGQRCDDRAGIAAECANGLDVGQNAGTAGGIDTGDRQDVGDRSFHNLCRQFQASLA